MTDMNFNFVKFRVVILLLLFVFFFYSCKAFKHASSYAEAQDTYLLITGNKDNFGDKRLSYNKYLFRCQLEKDFFCIDNENAKKDPDFIYEYISERKTYGIEFFYIKLDSVFVFEETKRNISSLKLKETRKLSDFEKQIYQKLIEQSKK
jgi:hypothetical protein